MGIRNPDNFVSVELGDSKIQGSNDHGDEDYIGLRGSWGSEILIFSLP
jgi:hypothetical protein